MSRTVWEIFTRLDLLKMEKKIHNSYNIFIWNKLNIIEELEWGRRVKLDS